MMVTRAGPYQADYLTILFIAEVGRGVLGAWTSAKGSRDSHALMHTCLWTSSLCSWGAHPPRCVFHSLLRKEVSPSTPGVATCGCARELEL